MICSIDVRVCLRVVGALRAPIEIYLCYYFGGPKSPQRPRPRGPESTPRAQKRGPRGIPNDSRVGHNSTKQIKHESKRQALSEEFYIENKRFDLDTLRVPGRSPTPISKSNDILGQSADFRGARGSHFRPILGVPGVRAGLKTHMFHLAVHWRE